MSRKSRRSRSNRAKAAKAASGARPNGDRVEPVMPEQSAASEPTSPGPSAAPLPLVGPVVVAACEADPFAASEPSGPSIPPVDLDVPFFDELPAESWLAHELELRDPRLVLKMTDTAARRRAHFAKYVAGVVAVSAVLCLAALVKAAVPIGADDAIPPSGRPAAASPVSPAQGEDPAHPAVERADPAFDLSGDGG